jgi:hypothetical protein
VFIPTQRSPSTQISSKFHRNTTLNGRKHQKCSILSYKKRPVTIVPETPAYLKKKKKLLSSASSSSPPSSPNYLRELTLTPSSWLGSPFDMLGWMDGSSSQPRVRQPRQSDARKLAAKSREWRGFSRILDSILLVNFWEFFSTIRVISLGSLILEVPCEGCCSVSPRTQ